MLQGNALLHISWISDSWLEQFISDIHINIHKCLGSLQIDQQKGKVDCFQTVLFIDKKFD